MTRPAPGSNHFILEAFDRNQWCAVLQALFHVADLDSLRSVLGEAASADPELRRTYLLSDSELSDVIAKFGVAFDPARLECTDLDIGLFRWRHLFETPYLVHTGYELPLLLDGRKKLGRFLHTCPPAQFDGEDRFEHWVAQGLLHREEVFDASDSPSEKHSGLRTVYYAPKGEEWRISASKLIWEASGKSGGWNEHFERLEGMLYRYEDWQNDWWIKVGLQGGGFGGLPLCCTVTSAGLAWIEASGFRALPPIDKPTLSIASYDVTEEADLRAVMLASPDAEALVRFVLSGRVAMDFIDSRHGGPWLVSRDRIPKLNRNLRGSVEVVARRESSL
jgi:hypothetical protein